mmetsp:Transcript_11299/g.18397  ORF Transcript_11299/g.18397 Transcript_11299/m.18397 type:complete len:110 (+) Transcript_11299:397-726(+)
MIMCVEWSHGLLAHEHRIRKNTKPVEDTEPGAVRDESGVKELRGTGDTHNYNEYRKCEESPNIRVLLEVAVFLMSKRSASVRGKRIVGRANIVSAVNSALFRRHDDLYR